MELTVEMRAIYKNTASPLKATANIVIDDCFVIRNVKLIDNGNGLFMSMPSYKSRDEKWRSVCHPITSECRTVFEDALLEAYKQG